MGVWAHIRNIEHLMGGRWLELEPIMLANSGSAYWYSVIVVKGRWPEAELILAQDTYWDVRYRKFLGLPVRDDVTGRRM